MPVKEPVTSITTRCVRDPRWMNYMPRHIEGPVFNHAFSYLHSIFLSSRSHHFVPPHDSCDLTFAKQNVSFPLLHEEECEAFMCQHAAFVPAWLINIGTRTELRFVYRYSVTRKRIYSGGWVFDIKLIYFFYPHLRCSNYENNSTSKHSKICLI